MKKQILFAGSLALILFSAPEVKGQLPPQQQQQMGNQGGPVYRNQQSSGNREIICGNRLAIYVTCGSSSGEVQLIIEGMEQRDKIRLTNSGDGVACRNDELLVNPSNFCPGPVQLININSHGGDDRIHAFLAPLSAGVVIHGGAGNDNIKGHSGHDEIYGEGGNDDIFAHEGDDIVFGGGGNDRIDLALGDDTCYGGSGNDAIFSTYGSLENYVQYIYGDSGNDYIEATSGTPWTFGGSGHDSIIACGDIHGGAGDDRLIACSCGEPGSGRARELVRERLSISGGTGSDRIKDVSCGNDDHYILSGGEGNDYYYISNNNSEVWGEGERYYNPGTNAITGQDVEGVFDGDAQIVENLNPRCSDGGRGTCSSSFCTEDEPFCHDPNFFDLVRLSRPQW